MWQILFIVLPTKFLKIFQIFWFCDQIDFLYTWTDPLLVTYNNISIKKSIKFIIRVVVFWRNQQTKISSQIPWFKQQKNLQTQKCFWFLFWADLQQIVTAHVPHQILTKKIYEKILIIWLLHCRSFWDLKFLFHSI